MSTYLKHNCHECGNRISYPDHAAGTTVNCPQCGKTTALGNVYPSATAVLTPVQPARLPPRRGRQTLLLLAVGTVVTLLAIAIYVRGTMRAAAAKQVAIAAERHAQEVASAKRAADSARQQAEAEQKAAEAAARQRAEEEQKAIATAQAEVKAALKAEVHMPRGDFIELSAPGWGEVILFDPNGVVFKALDLTTKRIQPSALTESDLLALVASEKGYKALTELKSHLPRTQASGTLEQQLDTLWRKGQTLEERIRTRLSLMDNLSLCNYVLGISSRFGDIASAGAQNAVAASETAAAGVANAIATTQNIRDLVTVNKFTGAEIYRRPFAPDVKAADLAQRQAEGMLGQAGAALAQAQVQAAQAASAKIRFEAAKAALAQSGIQVPESSGGFPTLSATAELNALLQEQRPSPQITAERAALTDKMRKQFSDAQRQRFLAQERAPFELAEANANRRINLTSPALRRTGFTEEQIKRVFAQGGRLIAWGGDGALESTVQLKLNRGLVAVAAGGNHSLALLTGGSVVAWGKNEYNQTSIPNALGDVAAIAAGAHHSLAMKGDGGVVAWGAGAPGGQGIGHNGQSTVPRGLGVVVAIAAGGYHSLALKMDGSVVAWGKTNANQCSVPAELSDVIAIAAGEHHSLAATKDGRVVAWGRNDDAQCNVPAELSEVMAVAAGVNHSLALKKDGTVRAWGKNDFQQCSVPEGLTEVVLIAAGEHHSLAVKRDGSMVAWGTHKSGAEVLAKMKNVVAIAAGEKHSLAVALW